MSEVIVAKAGGTSNRDAEAVLRSLDWAERADVFVVSAPGKLTGDIESPKVTDMLLGARAGFLNAGEVSPEATDVITDRFASIVDGLGGMSLPRGWVDKIAPRVEETARQSEDAVSMLGERLQAEIYEAQGYTLLDPSRAPHDLGNDPEAWRGWLGSMVKKGGNKYILPGNTTLRDGRLVTFSRGGSDTSGGLAAYGVQADLNLNLTDDSALSADPRLILPNGRLKRLEHLLYEEGRELGRNGTGLLHPAAMVPLMLGDIRTEIRSTFDTSASPTVLDNDYARAERRAGQITALSLMENVTMHRVHEVGMAEGVGRLAVFETALAASGIPIIDSKGDGVDGQKYFVDTSKSAQAKEALLQVTHGKVESSANLSFVTLVGNDLGRRLLNNIMQLALDPGFSPEAWQAEGHDLSLGKHSLRISVKPEDAQLLLSNLHHSFIEAS